MNQDNSLSLVRLLAALQVMVGHTISHLDVSVQSDFVKSIISFYSGVPIFFTMSGFLIWFSITQSRNINDYVKKRFWRIYPELWISVVVELIVMLILYKGVELTSFCLFGLTQGSIFQFWTPDSLRGYGVGTPNGSLWTIGITIQFYIIAWPFYKLMKSRGGGRYKTWMIGLILSILVSSSFSFFLNTISAHEIVKKLYGQTIIKFFWLFYIGMFIAEFKDKILPLITKYWYMLIMLSAIFYITKWDVDIGYKLLRSLFLVCGVIGFAYCFPEFIISIDISYGIYLYHMIIVNVFVNFNWTGKALYVIAVVFITLILSFISTITIGKFSYKKARSKRD